MKRFIFSILALSVLAISLSGCGNMANAANGDLMNNIKPNEIQPAVSANNNEPQAVYNFAVQLFQQSYQQDEQQNTLISPLSVLLALSMTANGAAENTLAQMEQVFGLPMEQLNNYLLAYTSQLPQTEKSKLSIANSIWLKDTPEITAKPDFLQTNADYYQSGIYQVPFDSAALKQINSWVKENTGGMIENILNQINEDAVIYLINALAFDAEWKNPYREYQIQENIFTTEQGAEQKADFMYSSEHTYLQDENTRGFVKYYAGGGYAFVGLLPDEGISLADYLNSLSGEKLYNLLHKSADVEVHAAIPKFKTEYSVEMNELLQNMGITDAFNFGQANFSAMADFPAGMNLYISNVLHKTYIEVNENGTKAAAATAVELECGAMPAEDYQIVELNRPFVYLLIDCENQLPLFTGVMQSVK